MSAERSERLDTPVGVVAIPSGEGRSIAVELTEQPADGAVTQFLAPHKNFE